MIRERGIAMLQAPLCYQRSVATILGGVIFKVRKLKV